MPDSRSLRAILPLLKARVVDRGPTHFKLAIGGSTIITITCNMPALDIRDGDLFTLYTEVPLAHPSQSPIE